MVRRDGNSFFIETEKTSYIFRIDEAGKLEHVAYCGRICGDESSLTAIVGSRDVKIGDGIYLDENNQYYLPEVLLYEYSAPGKGDLRESAIVAEYSSGLITLDPIYHKSSIWDNRLELVLKDRILPVFITLVYKVYPESDVIVRSVSVRNDMDVPLILRTVASMQLDLDDSLWDLISFDGAWAAERSENRRRIQPGTVSIESRGGFTSSEHSNLFFLARPDADDRKGCVIGFEMIYSGNHLERIEVSPFGKCRVLSSISSFGFSWELRKGESFNTPEAVMTLSEEGIDGASWNLQRFASDYVSSGIWQKKERPVLLNSWEATYFDITEEKLLRFAEKAASVGIELFVLDDGWFGHRTDDTRGLGDWTENKERLPDGLEGLSDKIHKMGMLFGIWVEPEMVSLDSELYEKHPEWMMAIPGRDPSPCRHQFMLDMSRCDVGDYLFDSLSAVFKKGIDYVKWDANRNMSDYYTSNPELRSCGELFHGYIKGLYSLLKRLKEAFPTILFEFCSSGGNRFDLGMLSFMNQGWVSDNTDIRARVKIQHGTLRGFPLSAVCNHVSASPNHQSLRKSGIDDRFSVACFGILGYELDLLKLSDNELDAIREQIAFYKAHRKTFQFGRFRHLPSVDKESIFWSVELDNEIIVLEYQDRNEVNTGRHHRLIIPFAEDGRKYRIWRREKYIDRIDLGDAANEYDAVIHDSYSITVDGSVLRNAGIALPITFMGRGFTQFSRLLLDNSADLFVIEKL